MKGGLAIGHATIPRNRSAIRQRVKRGAKQALKAVIPRRHHAAIRTAVLRALYRGDTRYCPCCNSSVRAFGSSTQPKALARH